MASRLCDANIQFGKGLGLLSVSEGLVRAIAKEPRQIVLQTKKRASDKLADRMQGMTL